MRPSELKIILSSAPDMETAETLSRRLVEAGLVACAQILPEVRSLYFWEDKLEESRECLLILKSSKVKECMDLLEELHPYENPEGLVLSIEEGRDDYLNWAERLDFRKQIGDN